MYLKWNEQIISDFSDENINRMYNDGYVFGRPGKGYMNQTRSLRIDLSKFELSSENRRVLRNNEDLKLEIINLPYKDYSWEIGKLAKDFYETKFGKGTFSANKVREILTTDHNFNKLFVYSLPDETALGYCITLETNKIIHYSYPFYKLLSNMQHPASRGMSLMVKAIKHAKEQNKKYIYLGSAKDEKAKYKLQFKGLEWFDGNKWSEDLEELKNILK